MTPGSAGLGTMRAAVWSGGGVEDLTIETIPVPKPLAGEALIRVAACGVCHTDLHVMKGEVGFPAPAVLGHEVSGTIVGFGPASDEYGLAIGDRVVGAFIMPCGTCRNCVMGRDDMCSTFFAQNRLKGNLLDGTSRLARTDGTRLSMYSMAGLAEYAVVPVTALSRLPESIPIEQAAILGCAAFTAFGAVSRAELRAGETVAVVATGGVGSSIIQVAKHRGASLIVAIDISDEKLEGARRLGAHETINSRDADVAAVASALTEGEGFDVVFEALGTAPTFEMALSLVREGGRMVAVGIASRAQAASVEITPLVRRGQSILGSYGARTRVDLPRVIEMAAGGGYDVEGAVTRKYPLEAALDAYLALARGEIDGRAIITME